jgi:hypothetical protein
MNLCTQVFYFLQVCASGEIWTSKLLFIYGKMGFVMNAGFPCFILIAPVFL